MKVMTFISPEELAKKAMEMKSGQFIDISMYYEGDPDLEPEQWIRMEKLHFYDSEIVMLGGYTYKTVVIANEYELYESPDGVAEIVKNIKAYAESEFDTDCRYMAVEEEVSDVTAD